MFKVLVADDEHNIRHILDFSLHAEGFDVIAVHSGEEAFEKAVTEGPDLIILDVMMPGQGGIATCKQLKSDERTRAIPVVMLTAMSSAEDREKGAACGANDYITKPFSPQKVIDTVQGLLGVTS